MTIHVPPPAPAGQHIGRRGAARVRLGIPSTLILLDGNYQCVLQDLSQTGARLSVNGYTGRAGQSGVLEMCGHEAFGTVVWARMGMLALHFDEMLAMPTIVKIRHFSESYASYKADENRRIAREFVQGRQQTADRKYC